MQEAASSSIDASRRPAISSRSEPSIGATAVANRVLAEQLRLVYAQLPEGIAVTLAVAGLLSFMLWKVVPLGTLALWLAATAALVLGRFACFVRYRKRSPEDTQLASWRNRFVTGSTAQGVLWGVAGVLLFPETSAVHQMFLVVVLCGMVGGAVGYLSPLRWVYPLYAFPAMVPITVRLLAEGTPAYVITGLMGFVFLGGVFVAARASHESLRRAIRLSIEKQMLADTIATAKQRLERANRQYEAEIEERKRAERELERHRSNLEVIVAERTKALEQANRTLRQEVAERKQAQEELRRSEEKYRHLVENVNDVIFSTDEQGVISYISPTIKAITGYEPSEIIGRPFSDFIHPDDLPRIHESFHRILGGALEPSEYRVLGKDGIIRWVRNSSRPFLSDEGTTGLRGVLVDLTEIKRAEAERERLREQLVRSQKMEAIGTLAGGIAHDFRNLLQVIQGYADLGLVEAGEGGAASSWLEQILEAAERGSQLAGQLLTFSRRTETSLAPLALIPLVRRIHTLLQRTLPKTIHVELRVPPVPLTVRGDPAQLEQVLLNLALNARDAMPNGGSLTIETTRIVLGASYAEPHPEMEPGEYARLRVTDTGCGIDSNTLERIFDPFFTTKDVGEGTGLGLSTAYGIVKNHDGHIECRSRPGEGTRFEIYLPLLVDSEAPLTEIPRREEVEPGLRGTVLLVDDETDILASTAEFLGSLGYRIEVAASGEEAVDLYRRQSADIDLVLLDLGMPGMSGQECLAELLNINPEGKVLVASGYSAEEHAKPVLDQGAKDFINKPYRLGALARKISEVLAL